ncbi:zinc finger protein 28 homolog [Alligator sinensis]|uniref:Zinc finger protein 28 homolog n=1 Tax=Alligator sinensis TaxID=38654 RepID=A0A3Q0G0Q7_ALLSI|nr:zinc finger protein 28 homolog [Alligator sinensis]
MESPSAKPGLYAADVPNPEETWELSADNSCSGWCPRQGPSPGAGAGTLSRAEQQLPEEGPGNLELQRTSPGRPEERSSRTPEPGQVQRGQGRPPEQEESWELQEVFEDVAVYFSRKEWELLEDDDKVLYRDQMLKNYQALVSRGKARVLASPVRALKFIAFSLCFSSLALMHFSGWGFNFPSSPLLCQ